DNLPTGTGTIGTITDNQDGTYTATFTAGTTAGVVSITPKLNGTSFANPINLTVTPGAPSTSNSTVSGTSSTMVAGSGATSTLTVTLKDANGNNLTSSGGTVTFSVTGTGTGTLSTVTDNGNGTYTVTYTAGTTAGNVSILPRINGNGFASPLNLSIIPGAVSTGTSVVTASPSSLVVGTGTTSILTVQLKDANGNNLTSSAGAITFASLASGAGSLGTVTDNLDGTYTVIYTVGTNPGTVAITAELNGTSFTNALNFIQSPPNQSPTDISLSATSIAENQPTGSTVGQFSTTDPDSGNTFTYALVSGNGDADNGSFQIVNGELRTNAAFDYETKN
ncbi:MAG: invasin domain 3-containing protein, partial [Planctomycetia bacterium]